MPKLEWVTQGIYGRAESCELGFARRLETHLKLLQRQRIISTWHDRKIPAGSEWDREIYNRLEHARIILLLISSDFLLQVSDYAPLLHSENVTPLQLGSRDADERA